MIEDMYSGRQEDMKYLVCQKQKSEGCDYTIGCGMRFDFVTANSTQDVIEQIVFPDGRDEYCTLEGTDALAEILIVPAEYITVVDVAKMAKELERQRACETAEAQKAQELAELKRLQEKYKRNAT